MNKKMAVYWQIAAFLSDSSDLAVTFALSGVLFLPDQAELMECGSI